MYLGPEPALLVTNRANVIPFIHVFIFFHSYIFLLWTDTLKKKVPFFWKGSEKQEMSQIIGTCLEWVNVIEKKREKGIISEFLFKKQSRNTAQ